MDKSSRQSPKKSQRKSTFKCPDCGSNVTITQTKILSPTYKEFYASCTNDLCGGRYVFGSEPVRVLIPSQTPNKRISLPLARNLTQPKDEGESYA